MLTTTCKPFDRFQKYCLAGKPTAKIQGRGGRMMQESETAPASEEEVETEAQETQSDLESRIWSVIAFDGPVAKNLTYQEAIELRNSQALAGRSGLCIVTDVAAERFGSRT